LDEVIPTTNSILIASDFDGTLCSIASTPSAVWVEPSMLDTLQRLIHIPKITLVVISGRSIADLSLRIPLDIPMAGNHGLEISVGGTRFVHPDAANLVSELAGICSEVVHAIRPHPKAFIENKQLSATLHYRNVPSEEVGDLLAAVERCLAGVNNFSLSPSKMALEIRPLTPWNKGSALQYFSRECGPFDLILCLGDDLTDESMFQANPNGVNVCVGMTSSTCRCFRARNCGEVEELLRYITAQCGNRAGSARSSAVGGMQTTLLPLSQIRKDRNARFHRPEGDGTRSATRGE
jgi:trehalose 6-phosphate phosphatase